MKSIVEKGQTLMVDGPASVSLLSGDVNVLGAPLEVEEKLVVREGKRLPFMVVETSTLELLLGQGACVNEVEGESVPSSWVDAADQILGLGKPTTVLVVGGVDSGKTSFCTFVVNQAVKQNLRTCVIDADLGQSDIGPPSTVGYNVLTEPVKDLFEIDAKDAVFVGSTSPSGAINKVVDGLVQLKGRIMDAGVDLLVVNTDGWVEGDEAVGYKRRLIGGVGPDVVVGLQQTTELNPILDKLSTIKTILLGSPELIASRSRDKRKLLRELTYKKYLKNAKVQSFSLNWINVEDSILGAGGQLHHKRLQVLRNLLRVTPLYSEETLTDVLVVLNKISGVNEEQIEAAEDYFQKRVKIIREGDEEGLLVGLKDEEDHFLGIGVINEVDYKRKVLKVFTPVAEKVSTISFGQITLDKTFKELGLSTVFASDL